MLIVAPLRPCYKVWPDEIEKWADFNQLRWCILHGPRKMEKAMWDADIHIINPEGLLWLLDPNTKHLPYDVLCIDESSKFKDSTTQRFKILRPLIPTFKRRWILTGTPSPNGLMDLFGQIYILDLGRSLGKFITHYRMKFFQQSGYGGYTWTPVYGSFEKIVEQISPLILQMSAEENLQMPELMYSNLEVDLPEKAMAMYRDVEEQFITEVEEGSLVAANAAVAGMKCRQIANGAVYYSDRLFTKVHDAKLDALEDLVEELNGAPLLLLYEFDHDRQRILERFPNTPVLGSSTTPRQLEQYIDGFNEGKIPVLLGHPASMGHGLNLQGACHHVCWFGITWNLEFYDQAIARIYRQGQQAERVMVYHIVAKDTLDEKVLGALQRKDKSQQGLLSALRKHREENYDL